MIYELECDVLERDFTHILHQCNCYCVMGSGLALQIKNRYRPAFLADLKTKKGDLSKLGTYSYGVTDDGKIIYNLYSQAGYGSKDRQTSYDAMDKGLRSIRESFRKFEFEGTHVNAALPYKLGCGLANGDWKVVLPIIERIFEHEDYPVTICRLPGPFA